MTSSLRQTIRGATLIGLDNSVRAVAYAIQRARLDARDRRRGPVPPDQQPAEHGPGSPRHADELVGGLRLAFDRAVVQVRFLADGGVFVGWAPGPARGPAPGPADRPAAVDPPGPEPSYALATSPTLAGPTAPGSTAAGPAIAWASDVDVEERDDGWLLTRSSTGLGVRIQDDGTLTFLLDNKPVRTDEPPRWRGREWRSRTRLSVGAGLYGLGGRSTRPSRRGEFRLWNTEPGGSWTEGSDPLSITMPLYLVAGDAGAALTFFDDTFDGTVTVDDQAVELRMTDGPLRYYVFAGTLPRVYEEFGALTGRPALPPRWAFGYHQARWGYDSEHVVRTIAGEFRRRQLPLSGIWLDIDHMRDKAVFTVDPARFPDLPGLAESLAADGTRLVAIVDPAVPFRTGNPVYESGMARGVFCRDVDGNVSWAVVWPGVTVYPDFTSPRTREWWGEQYRTQLERGFAGFWHDMNEPSAFVAIGDPTLPLSTRHELDGRGGDHREAHNVYGLQMNRAGYEALREQAPDSRPFLVSRSGWVGMQRYGGAWSGDIATSWEALRASLWFTIGLSMSGVPYSGPDIGGFDGHPDPELFARWFQLAAYLPFFRTHSSFRMPPREPWVWPAAVQTVLRSALADRYALLPYWYSLAHRASRTGVPYVRPLCWADPGDPALRKVDDAFLLGDAVLVAPVLTAGADERKVRLPAGRWYDRRDGTVYEGPGTVSVTAELSGGVPVLVRAGSVLPVSGRSSGSASDDGELVLEAYRPDEESGADAGGGGTDGDQGSGQGSGPDGGPGGELYTDAGDGWDEPILERFTIRGDEVHYDGPADALPYPIRWVPQADE